MTNWHFLAAFGYLALYLLLNTIWCCVVLLNNIRFDILYMYNKIHNKRVCSAMSSRHAGIIWLGFIYALIIWNMLHWICQNNICLTKWFVLSVKDDGPSVRWPHGPARDVDWHRTEDIPPAVLHHQRRLWTTAVPHQVRQTGPHGNGPV